MSVLLSMILVIVGMENISLTKKSDKDNRLYKRRVLLVCVNNVLSSNSIFVQSPFQYTEKRESQIRGPPVFINNSYIFQ